MSRPYNAGATPPAGWLTRGRKPSHRSSVVIDRGKDPAKQALPGAGVSSPVRQVPGQLQPEVILTPDQRVRVFISSTLGELAAERAAARRAIARLHLVPVYYESGARPHPPRNIYRAYLEQSQIFVGIYWQRYGWVAPGMEISGLEDEFRLAAGKPMLLYLKRPPRELERLLAEDLAVLLSESFAGAAASTEASAGGLAESAEADLPAGTVTFLLTDIEGSIGRAH